MLNFPSSIFNAILHPRSSTLYLILILLFAFSIRIYDLNWDQSQHLHPDERFLTMVAVAQKVPTSISQYLSTHESQLNPTNIGFPFYVYGTFPVTVVTYISTLVNLHDYINVTLVGRLVSAFMDVGIAFFVYKMTELFEERYKWNTRIKFVSAFLYSIMVLPIQQAHFFTVDTFVTFFIFGSLYFALKNYYSSPSSFSPLLSGLFLGLALASKINAIYILPLIVALIFLPILSLRARAARGEAISILRRREISTRFLALLGMTVISYLTLRFADPYLFATTNFFDLRPNLTFLSNIHQLQSFNNPNAWFPPGVQWISKTKLLFPLVNIIFFGMGSPLFIAALLGSILLIKKNRGHEIILLYLWMLGFFLYQGMQFAMTMRYFYILYPLLAIPAGYFLVVFCRKKSIRWIVCIALILIWPYAFMSIYTHPHSRVTASQWIYENIPAGSILAQEHWDDSLPLSLSTNDMKYDVRQMPVFGPDNSEKWKQIDDILASAHYIIFTSNRGYGSIGTVPGRYPKMSKFYNDLFAGNLNFKKIKEFTSYPSTCFIPNALCFMINDQWSEEAFTVYDHPKVTIFMKK